MTVLALDISNFTLFSLPQGNTTLIIELNYVGAGGITWDRSKIKFFNGGQEPALTNQAGKTDVLSCTCNGTYLGCILNPDLA